MSNEKFYNENCFVPNWLEVRVDKVENTQAKEVRLESKRRKDLNTLLEELELIKQNIERAAEKQQKLAELMLFYTNQDLAQ